MSALDPNKPIDPANDQHPTRLQELDQDDSTVQQTLAENLDVHSLDSPTTPEHSEPDADPVWTWNAPQYLTDDNYGILQLSHSDGTCDCLSPNPQAQAREPISQFLRPWAPPDVKEHDRKLFQALVFDKPLSNIYSDDRRLRLKEKADNLRTYFGSKEEFEKAKGGRTHYKVKLSFEVPATNQQIRELTNESLQQTFPRSIAFAAIHRDTDHPHVHLYLHSRQIDGKRIQLKNNDYRSVDEKWARLYSDFAGDRSIYVEHLRKKEETREWKIAAAEAYQKGQLVPPKPERDSDRREKLAERRLSAQRSKARDQGQKLEPRPQAEPVIRPSSEKETGRLLAKHEVAQERLAHLIRTEALQTQIYWAGRNAHDIAVTLDKTLSARKEMGKAKLPAVVYTIDEVKELQEYTKSRDLPVTDDHAGRLQATQVVSAAELKDAQSKAEAFQASRHFWKLDVPGWEKGLTLKEVEDRIKFHNDQRFRLYNFLRPTRRESIQNAIDYFQETKKDMQNQLAAKELPIQKNLSTAQLKYDTVSKLIENAEKARFPQSRSMPRPLFYRPDLVTLHEIAHRNKDAELLGYLYGQVKDKVLANPSPETLSRLKGNAVIARIEMLKEADRLKAAVEFREFRRLPLKDAQGRDYTRSLREVQPKTALELIVRHFTDTGEQKKEGKALAEASARQLERAEAQYNKAREWSLATDKIAHDHYRAARVSEKQIAPRLSPEQIVQVKQYGGTLPLLSQVRRQFKEDARMAERRFQQMELALGSGPAQQTKSPEPTPSTAEQSPMEIITNTSVRTRQYPQLGATQLNDHQIRDANPATDAQRTNTPPVHAEPHGRSLSLSAATTPTPDLFRRDPQQFAKAIEIANTNKDAKLLSQLYDIAKDKLLKRVSPESLSYLKGQAILGRMEMAQRADSLAEAYQQHRVVPPPHDAPNRLANLPAEVKIAEQEHSKARDWSLIRDRIAADRFKAAGVVESQVVPDLDRQQITQLREFANTLPELSMFRKEFTEAAIIAEQALLQREAAQSAKRESQIARPQDHATRDRESSPPNLRSTHDRDR